MYADRLEGEFRASIQHRLTGNLLPNSAPRLSFTRKRERQDDIWKHDLYEDEQPRISRRLGGGDLRLKLRRKITQQDANAGGARDLREMLSGIIQSEQIKKHLQKSKPEPERERVQCVRRTVIVEEAPVAEPNKVPDPASRKNTHQKTDSSVDGFLKSLGLEKYLVTFQAEEVDMTALEHLTDDDLKAMGIPMGPRKKILLALKSKG